MQVDVSDTNPGLEITDGGVRVKVDDSSIERASGGIQVKALGITDAMLAGSISAGKLAGSIPDSALSQITTASKVSTSALTGAYLGSWASISGNTTYLAATDGFVVGFASRGTLVTLRGYTDASNPPTTERFNGRNSQSGVTCSVGICLPVKKGNYYKVVEDNGGAGYALFFISIGS